jgi:Ketosteroid isomerase homolog
MQHFEFRTAARVSSVLLSTALVMSFAGCSRAIDDAALAKQQADNEAAIRRLDAAWVKAAASKDPDAWVAFYADNATVLPPNEKALTGKAAVRRSIGEFLSLPNLQLSWEPTKVEVASQAISHISTAPTP